MRFAELDRRDTPMGEISLRERYDPSLGVELQEVRLGEEFLMSSLFTVAEEALGTLGLAELPGAAAGLDVVVGGLGLGYTAAAVLTDDRVGSLVVVDALEAVLDWHREGLLPLAATLTGDPRCTLRHADFFALVAAEPERAVHAVLLDVDHSPRHVLAPSHAALYTVDGLTRLRAHLHPGGVFGLWSDDPPEDALLADLAAVFTTARAEVVTFPNPYTGGESANTVYLAVR